MLCVSAACAVMWCLSVRPTVMLSVTFFRVLSKRVIISSDFFQRQVATPFLFFRVKPYGCIPRGVECRGYEEVAIFYQYLALSWQLYPVTSSEPPLN